MSIQEQAQQVDALADQVPTGVALATKAELEAIQNQVVALLGHTATADTLQGAIQNAAGLIDDLTAALENVKIQLRDVAQHHLAG
jgi:hypothetical protein